MLHEHKPQLGIRLINLQLMQWDGMWLMLHEDKAQIGIRFIYMYLLNHPAICQ